jgi:amino acid adenylation domain-containing protein
MSAHVDAAALDQRVDRLITQQARRAPERIAAVCGGESMSYAELDAACDGVAARLHALGAMRGALVGVHLERSLQMLIAVIAVMKTGAAYVPLDPEFPAERLTYMVADAKLGLVISQSSLAAAAPAGDYRRFEIDRMSDSAPPAELPDGGGGDLIYVLYTSGSTGRPKGVALEHRNVVNFLLSMQQEPGMAADDRIVAVTTLSFDIAGLELYLPLISGATVVIAQRDETADGEGLRRLLENEHATVMQATPSTWRLLIEAGWSGSQRFKALCGGEALPADLARALVERSGELWNLYGPTETAIWSSCYRVPHSGAPILIGRPIANTRIYVLDKSGRPVPTGVPGEIVIGGAGVARGYLGRDDLTAERFVADPFWNEHGGRMYRTGDVGRYLVDGQIEFRQRADNQVKVRGFRVELAEVELALASHPQLKQVVARVVEVRSGDARLVAYLVPSAAVAPTPAELREHLRASVPQYMIPHHFVALEQFPMTPNGKVDRARLPGLHAADLLADRHVEPSTPSERLVAQVFREVLAIDRVSAEAGFFDLGGHSVIAARAVAQLRKRAHAGFTLRMLFEAPSVAALAQAIDALPQQRREEPVRAVEHDLYEF